MKIQASSELHLPYLTRDLPGIGGMIKVVLDDFQVEEVPLYNPSDEGTHVYFMIEKRGLGTMEAVRRIGRALGRRDRDFGYAGLKDARGVTRQVLSLEHIDPKRIKGVEVPGVRVLWIRRHRNKLRIGHLAGNRFVVRIRECAADASDTVRPVLEVLQRRGVPNYFGPQRFGTRGNNAAIGAAILAGDFGAALRALVGAPWPAEDADVRRARELADRGDYREASRVWPPAFNLERRVCRELASDSEQPQRGWRLVSPPMRRLYVSALQSDLFNRVMAVRIQSVDRIEEGDLAYKHANGACFLVQDAAVEQPRCDAFEISPTGPIFGARMTAPSGKQGEREERVLVEAGVRFDRRRAPDGTDITGARRPLRVPLRDLDAGEGRDGSGRYLQLSFTLPPGAYATNVTREVCKAEAAD